MQCTNHLKQVALACHNFHDTYSKFPNSAYTQFAVAAMRHVDPTWSEGAAMLKERDRWGFACELLPFIERASTFDLIVNYIRKDTGSNYGPYSMGTATDPTGLGYMITPFLCPSDPNGVTDNSGTASYGRLSYHICMGDTQVNFNDTNAVRYRNIFRSGRVGSATFSTVTDGTSNTVILAECVVTPDGGSKKVAGGVGLLSGNFKPSACLSTATGKELNGNSATSSPSPPAWYGQRTNGLGDKWGEALGIHCHVNTILPPNAPTCSAGSASYPSGSNAMVTASSNHSGGVNVAMGDGAVRFVSSTIDAGNDFTTHDMNATQSSKSPYGVWGALGTASGGESQSF